MTVSDIVVTRASAQDHGTPAGYQRHRHRGEDACESCKLASRLYNNTLASTLDWTKYRIVHGTRRGYQTHLKCGERACELCKKAQREYQRDWNAARRARTQT